MLARNQDTNNLSSWRGKLAAYFDIFVNTQPERWRIFCVVCLSAFLYALFNDLILHRPPESVAKEVVILCVIGTITLPLFYIGYRVRKQQQTTPLRERLRVGALSVILISMMAPISIFGFCQTQFFISLLPYPKEEVLIHMKEARKVQQEIEAKFRAQYGQEPEGSITTSKLFPSEVQYELNEAITYLMNDESINAKLKQSFGITLRDARVVIVPSWKLTEDNYAQLGITDLGGKKAQTQAGEIELHGFIIRDKGGQEGLVTLDGVPRIFLGASAFSDRKTLTYSLFHELLHALNIPGYYPFPFTILQDDLTYLPVYRSIINEEHFSGLREYQIWLILVIMPLFFSGIALSKGLKTRLTIEFPALN